MQRSSTVRHATRREAPCPTPRTHRPPTASLAALAALALASVLGLPGCAGLEDVHAFRADADALRVSLEADARRWGEIRDALPSDHPDRTEAEAQGIQARAAAEAVGAGLARIDQIAREASKPTDPLTETISAAGPLLPPPLRAPLLLGAAALVVGARAWRLKAGLASVARGLAAALREDEEFRACFRRHADTFRATQTPTAKRIIDETTRPGPLLRLPL